MMKYLQNLGKALMLPVAVLPVCSILMGIGYALCPAVMQGGDIVGVVNQVGFFLVKAGGALLDNMPLLFAIGVSVGLADDHDGTSSLAGLVAWLTITTLLSHATVETLFPNLLADEVAGIAFDKIQNAFIGILSGIIGSACYNRFKGQQLPDFLAFFAGKRFVAIATAAVSLVVSAVLLVGWPLVFRGLYMLGEGIVGMGYVGAGIYAFLNRLLIPTGLHHALNNVFWFDTVGLGDLTHFWAGDVTGTNGVNWDLGIYMSGFFPCMMFGIPGACLAIYRNAKDTQKKAVVSLLLSTAICAFLCGVTEPFEFSFMFAAFPLYVVYSLLYAIFSVVVCLLGFRAGFSFSAGLTDLVFSSSLPAAAKTLLIIPLGIAAFAVFYVVFSVLIKRFDFKTPGRDEEDVPVSEKHIELANNDYTGIAREVLAALGGKDNISAADHCATRLRMTVKDDSLVNDAAAKAAGAAGVMHLGKGNVQVIIGTKVQFVFDELKKML